MGVKLEFWGKEGFVVFIWCCFGRRVVRRMLALVRYPGSAELRRGVVGALRNCCFEHGKNPGDLGIWE